MGKKEEPKVECCGMLRNPETKEYQKELHDLCGWSCMPNRIGDTVPIADYNRLKKAFVKLLNKYSPNNKIYRNAWMSEAGLKQ